MACLIKKQSKNILKFPENKFDQLNITLKIVSKLIFRCRKIYCTRKRNVLKSSIS